MALFGKRGARGPDAEAHGVPRRGLSQYEPLPPPPEVSDPAVGARPPASPRLSRGDAGRTSKATSRRSSARHAILPPIGMSDFLQK